MTDRESVLDASALVALLCREKGWGVISKILASGRAVTTPTGLAEALDICRRRSTGLSRTAIYDSLTGLGLEVEPLTTEDAVEIAFILERATLLSVKDKRGYSLSLGDAVCLAVGKRLNAIVVFSDNAWEAIDLPGIEIRPFR